MTQVVCVFERCWPSAGPGAAAAVCVVRCCCPAPSGELFASSVSVPSHCAARSPTPACAPKTQKCDSSHQTANYCMDSIYTMFEKFENKHFRWITFATLPFYEPFLYILLNTTRNPPATPTIVFLHLSVSRSVSCFCRASTFPCSSTFMSSSDWSFCLRSCSDLCSLWVTKYEEERQFKGM